MDLPRARYGRKVPLLQLSSEQLREELEAKGSIFQTTVDSEIILHLLAQPGDPRLRSSVQGLAASRRPRAVSTLAALLSEATSEGDAQAMAAALGEAASSWALATGKQTSAAEAKQVANFAAASLVLSYPRWNGPAAREIEASLKRVNHPETVKLLDKAAEDTPAQAPRFKQLAAALAK